MGNSGVKKWGKVCRGIIPHPTVPWLFVRIKKSYPQTLCGKLYLSTQTYRQVEKYFSPPFIFICSLTMFYPYGQTVVRYYTDYCWENICGGSFQCGEINGESRYTILRESKEGVCEKTHRSKLMGMRRCQGGRTLYKRRVPHPSSDYRRV